MAYDGSGVFNRLYNWQADAAAGIDILADRMDAEMDGFATGLSICLTRDGQAAMEAPLDMGGFRLINLLDPAADQDAVTKKFLETNFAAYLQVGPMAPPDPKMGSLWYRDVSPVGLFMYYVDVDSSQWIQLAGNGIVLPLATTDEARAGTESAKLMSPALVAARQGVIASGQLTTGTSFNFTGIPPEATEYDILVNFIGHGALGSALTFQPNGQGTGYNNSNVLLQSGTIGVMVTTAGAFGFNAAAAGVNSYLGLAQMRRNNNLVICSGKMRLTAGNIIEQIGQVVLTTAPMTSLLMTPFGASFTQGEAILKWRI